MTEDPFPTTTDAPAEGVEPAALGSAPSPGVLFAALYGDLTHRWPRDSEDTEDAYGLFYYRSESMGWLDERDSRSPAQSGLVQAPGLWELQEADWEAERAPRDSGQVSWFQVEVSPVPYNRPLPAQPFLHCAEASTRQAGTFTLTKVRIELPAAPALIDSPRDPHEPVPSLSTQGWFSACDPADQTSVQVSVSAGDHPDDRAALAQLGQYFADLSQSVFTLVDTAQPATGAAAELGRPVDHSWSSFFWNTPDRHGVVLTGSLAEWTGDAIGWLAGALADCFIHLGGRSRILVTVAKHQP
jgi:hypothetical protein